MGVGSWELGVGSWELEVSEFQASRFRESRVNQNAADGAESKAGFQIPRFNALNIVNSVQCRDEACLVFHGVPPANLFRCRRPPAGVNYL